MHSATFLVWFSTCWNTALLLPLGATRAGRAAACEGGLAAAARRCSVHSLHVGPFYVLCEDGETTAAQDNGRMQWAADDLIFRRAPLSRWSDEFKEEYKRVAAGF